MIDLRRPLQKSPEAGSLRPEKFPELQESDLRHLDAGIGFNPPKQEGTAPRGNPVAASGVPEKAQHGAHADSLQASVAGRQLGRRCQVPGPVAVFGVVPDT